MDSISLDPVALELINNISGAYSTPFWDGVLAISGSLDTVRNLKAALEALNSFGKYSEAYSLILAVYDLTGIEVPTVISELSKYPNGIKLYINEFLLDLSDLMYDYEYEYEGGDE